MNVRYALAALLVVAGLSGPARAGDYGDLRILTTKGDFTEIKEALENAIVSRGFKIDHHSFIGNMLKRTAKAVGATKVVYRHAEFFQFCSATLSRNTMEADPRNIGYCPYVIAVYETAAEPGTIHVGYRPPAMVGSEASKKALAAVDKVLGEIIREATEF